MSELAVVAVMVVMVAYLQQSLKGGDPGLLGEPHLWNGFLVLQDILT